MPVTELAHLTLLPTKSASKDVQPTIKSTMILQDKWCTTHAKAFASSTANSTISAENRGAAIFEQVEDPNKILVTAHWDSVEEHMSWISSAENKEACGYIIPHVDFDNVDFFHVQDAEMFPPSVLGGSRDVAEVVLTRFRVREMDKQSFEGKVQQSQALGGWRIEQDVNDDADVSQYIVAGKHSSDELGRLSISHEMRHYQKLCYE